MSTAKDPAKTSRTAEPAAARPIIRRVEWITLILAYAIACPWLILGEAVSLVPILCALVFGYCLISPTSNGMARTSHVVKAVIVATIVLLIAGIALAVTNGHMKAALDRLGNQPIWMANHIFFLIFSALPLSKGIAVGLIQLITQLVANPKS